MPPRFFGFGSLVNTRTHDYPNPQVMHLKGWRRVWRKTYLREVAFLSAEPCPNSTIWGLSAEVPDADWHALDQRETGYQRIAFSPDASLYSVPKSAFSSTPKGEILLSYLDVVIQGYIDHFGPDGPQHFFETTDGWDHNIVDDRSSPQYPRAQETPKALRNMVDGLLAAQMQQ